MSYTILYILIGIGLVAYIEYGAGLFWRVLAWPVYLLTYLYDFFSSKK